MRKILLAIALLVSLTVLLGCTDQQRAKKIGGTAKIELNPGNKLVIVTWKDSNLWILTRPTRYGEPVETYEFSESSSFGLLEGKIIIIEKR